jgi:hypothetical protein
LSFEKPIEQDADSFPSGGRQHDNHAIRELIVRPCVVWESVPRNNMHEKNREISSTPWSDDQGQSAKGINQTADMHMLEKSDCAVVPVNQPNRYSVSAHQ